MIRITQLKLRIDEDEKALTQVILQKLKIKESDLRSFTIAKQSLDARDKANIFMVYTIDVDVNGEENLLKRNKTLMETPDENYPMPTYGQKKLEHRPVVIGFGPGGMFSALLMAEMGLKPIVFERGSAVRERQKDIQEFWQECKLNVNSNLQFGEGGAGTFSDGKLTTRVKDIRKEKVLLEFVRAGAPEEILRVHNPHIGTDILVDVVKNVRERIIALGGEVYFNHVFERLLLDDGKITGVVVNGKHYETHDVVLAIGHSSRDTFTTLYEQGVTIEQKPFAIGVRIEHPQTLINIAQYGETYADHPRLGPGEYKLTHHASNDRGVYTFCMCPGGTVVACASEKETVVTNGMSEYLRDKENANSALVCTVNHKDFGSEHPLAGMWFQQKLEREAYVLGGSNYNAPIQRVEDFLAGRPSKALGSVQPSYTMGTTLTDLNSLFTPSIREAIKEGLVHMDRKLKGFALADAVITGIETRTSSPVRIPRDQDTLESINICGLYPCGEGAGYAGGIMSSAMDGMKISERIIGKYKRPE